MEFSRELRERVIAGDITVSVRLWRRPKVRVGGRYPVGPVHIEVDSMELLPFASIGAADVRRCGERDREALRQRAAHAGPIADDTLVWRVEFHVLAEEVPSSQPGSAHVAVSEQAKPDHRVVAGLLRQNGRVLLCHRSPQRDWYPDTWDLPGGHVEGEERPAQALARELSEELGILVTPPTIEPFAHVLGSDFRMDVWLVDEWTGQPSTDASDEHDALAWMNAEEAIGLRLADARLPALIKAALS